jgi:hypothetical protein
MLEKERFDSESVKMRKISIISPRGTVQPSKTARRGTQGLNNTSDTLLLSSRVH